MSKKLKKTISILIIITILFQASMAISENDVFYNKVVKVFNDYKTVGGSFIVYHKGKIKFIYNHGYADRNKLIHVDSDTKFRIASITKMVTALGIMQLVEQNKVKLDDDIGNILGYKIYNPKFPEIPITLRMLLCHTSSIQDSPRSAHKRGTIEQMLGDNRVNDMAFTDFKPGSKYIYSNFAFGLVGSIIEKISGQSLEIYMKTNIFNPLNIDAAYYASNLKKPNISARYYDSNMVQSISSFMQEKPTEDSDPEHNYNTAIGKLWISAEDLCKITCVLSGNGYFNGKQILKPETVMQMRKNQKDEKYISADTNYCLGLECKNNIIDGIKLYGHQGLYYSAYTDAFFDPDNLVSMVLLNNGIKVVRIDGTNAMARELFMLTYKYLITIDNNPFMVID